ncbi:MULTISPECIES: S-methyl-5-thioribose kinase [unclassified Paenibacillus]|uniref:S-methyl-5-thioribose kinase n=1 Tax=unclassified Paenibacillus TaxID=185978 RepID=UPI001C109449|nr:MULTISPECIES: S-methyl-5-thioribose kinase [unclassified Paenibacillus]MBU5441489.1 S-methyl-5-thioribose kinase [Paenibacillus sp. MSJ-34]
MSDFQAYFTMKEPDAIEYARTKLDFFAEGAKLTCEEIGDGNLNYVFRIVDENTGKSVIIKQAGPVARISDEFKVSTDRNRIESEILQMQYKLAPGLVPQVYKYDVVMNCCAMEDLSDHEIMRKALMEYKQFPLFADHITTFLVNTLLLTSDVVLHHKEKKELVKRFVNPDLCEITEDLVYTEPFYDCPRNDIFPATRAFAKRHLWEDEALQLETAKLKFEFMSNAQSLLHGDLHTGSIFIKPDSTKMIDPEFAFYGPAGYDVGNVIANLVFAYLYADATLEEGERRDVHMEWLLATIEDIVDTFQEKFAQAWQEHATERTAGYKGFREYYLGAILRDTAAAAGLELCRRTLGIAHVKDIVSIADSTAREKAERACLILGKKFIMERGHYTTGADYVRAIRNEIRY